jgi:hypothetical protein
MGPKSAGKGIVSPAIPKKTLQVLTESELGSGEGLLENMPPLLPLSESGSLLRLLRLLVLNVRLGGGLELSTPFIVVVVTVCRFNWGT